MNIQIQVIMIRDDGTHTTPNTLCSINNNDLLSLLDTVQMSIRKGIWPVHNLALEIPKVFLGKLRPGLMHSQLVSWCNSSFSTNRLHRAMGVWNTLHRAEGQHKHIIKQWNSSSTKKIINILLPGLCGNIPSPQLGFLKRSLSSQSLGKYWQLNQNNQKTEHHSNLN